MGDLFSQIGSILDPANLFSPGKNQPAVSQFMGNPDLKQYGDSPYSSSLKSMVDSFKAPSPIAADTSTYQAKDMSKSALPQYDAMRARLSSQYSQNQAQGQDAIDRQFAAAGGGPGNGAQAKQTENLVNATANAKSGDMQNIDAQEQQTRTGLQQAEDEKAFQSGEAEKGRALQTNEFNAGQQLQGQQMQFGENSTLAQLNQGWDEAQAEAKNNEFNKQMALFTAKHSGGLLGGGGFLGTGFFSDGL